MTLLDGYLLFGIPAIALLLAVGASWLVDSSWKREEAFAKAGTGAAPLPSE